MATPANLNEKIVAEQDSERWAAYRNKLISFVKKRVQDPAQAEDIVHDVLIKALLQEGKLRDQGNILPWLFQVTRNSIIDHYRTRNPDESLPAILSSEQFVWDEDTKKELSCCLKPMIKDLPEHYRQVLVLTELEDRPYKDVATTLGLSLSGVKTRVQRGRKKLKEIMLGCCKLEFNSRGEVLNFEQKKGSNKPYC